MENKVENENTVPPDSAGVAMFGDGFPVPAKAETVPSASTLPNSIDGQLDQLVADCQNWQEGIYKSSNEQLYILLQRCYSMYQNMCATRKDAKSLRNAVDAHLNKRGIKVSDNAHTITKIIKCVFGADRKRVSAYSIALRAALAANVKAANLPNYIRDKGGVEELRLAKSSKAITPKRKAEIAAGWVVKSNFGEVKSEQFDQLIDPARNGTQHVLIATQEAGGAFTVNALVSNVGVVNAALAAYYSQHKSQHDVAQIEQQTADSDADLTELIEAAAASTAQH